VAPDTTDSTPRFRCSACGNLTRFDVTSTRRTKAFHHYTVGGHLEVEDVEVLSEDIEDVSCRWCGSGAHVVAVSADEITSMGSTEDDAPP
jgi:hypothetical protein